MTNNRLAREGVWSSAAPAIRDAMGLCVRSRACQVAGVALTLLFIPAVHRQNDGLWFQGDAPRHAVNGLFWWDLLTTLPRDPMEFAIRYYARYPVINPAAYPPLFYILEGLLFATFGPSPHAAKLIVMLFAGLAGLYTMAWARRWIGSFAGWAGAFLAFMPGIVMWSNAVMLNIPATALGLASLYHFRCWTETARVKQLVLTALFSTAVLLTYYPGGIVLGICGAWALLRARNLRFERWVLWIAAGALVAFVPITMALLLAPVHTSRHLPTIAVLTNSATWTFYWKALPKVVGGLGLALGLAGGAAGLLSTRWRTEAAYVAIWIAVPIVGLSLLPARDARYILLVAPAFLIAVTIGLGVVGRFVPPLQSEWQIAVIAVSLAVGFWSAARLHVPQVSGFREIAMYLQQRAPQDAVLYDGHHDGLFGFYVRALDPSFERRVARADKLLYEFGPTTTFKWTQKSHVASTEDVVNLLRTRCGCRWVAIEVGRRPGSASGRRLLREAVVRSEFELVRSFPITGASELRVDLYRLVTAVDPVAAVDLRFPSFSNREFRSVVPITR